jgi:hypothetical protein
MRLANRIAMIAARPAGISVLAAGTIGHQELLNP